MRAQSVRAAAAGWDCGRDSGELKQRGTGRDKYPRAGHGVKGGFSLVWPLPWPPGPLAPRSRTGELANLSNQRTGGRAKRMMLACERADAGPAAAPIPVFSVSKRKRPPEKTPGVAVDRTTVGRIPKGFGVNRASFED